MKTTTTLSIFFALIFLGCKSENSPQQTTEPTSDHHAEVSEDTTVHSTKPDYPKDPKIGQLAQFLAGNSSEGYLSQFENDDRWNEFQTSIDKIWKKTENKTPIMRQWSEEEMSSANENGGTLFYPFSGPDFLHADIFFPNHEEIVMIGLEPIGSLPDIPTKMQDTSGQIYLNGVYKSLHAILGLSFFRTVAMAKDFKGEVDGTLPVLMHFIVRTGHEVLYQEKVGVQANGQLTTDLNGLPDSTYFGNRFYFKKPGEEKVRTLTYFAVNLQNTSYVSRGGLVAKGLNTREDFVAYLRQLNITSTYLKSASYLMHRPSFSIIRNVILDESEVVLQDDSGIPVQFFEDENWDLAFYGTYTTPINMFAERHQDDLKEIYEQKKYPVKNLPFGIGYQFHKGTSNLMRASRK